MKNKIRIACILSILCNVILFITLALSKAPSPKQNVFTIPADTITISEVRISESDTSFDFIYRLNFDPQFYDALGSHIIDDELLTLYYLDYEVNVELFIDKNSIPVPLNEVIHINELMDENHIMKQFKIEKNTLNDQELELLQNYVHEQRTDVNFAHFSIKRTDEDFVFMNIILSNE